MRSSQRRKASRKPTMLIAEDDEEIRFALTEIFVHDGFDVTGVADGRLLLSCLRRLERRRQLPDIIVTDHRMPGLTSTEVLEILRDAGYTIPVIVITAFAHEVETIAEALGACAVFEKPFDADDLRTVVAWWSSPNRRALNEWKRARHLPGSTRRLEDE
jgi:CheY-like chemotaxis protein